MSSNAQLIDQLTRRQILIQRYSNSVIRDLLPIWRELRQSILARMADEPTEFQQARMTLLLRDINGMIETATQQMELELTDSLVDFAGDEVAFAAKSLQTAVPIEVVLPSIEQTRAVVTRSQMRLITGRAEKRMTLNQLVAEFDQSQRRFVRTTIQAGALEGQTVQQMARTISTQVQTRSQRQAETLVRTAVNHVGSIARQRTYEANADVIAGEEYTATLDGRTRPAHAALDGQVFPIGRGPQTPNGYNCRCVRVPKVKDEFKIPGIEGERASMDGPVSAQTTYNSWLKRQPKEFQDEVLGPERAKLFRGGMNIQKFVDDRGVLYDIDQLRAMEGMALA